MLGKFFSGRKQKPSLERRIPTKSASDSVHTPATIPADEKSSSALKIVHAGGVAERYYMAVPAARIMEKHAPSFVLAKPDVFWKPWDSVVRPEEILIPGQKFFVVPRRTVKKLRRRIRKPNGHSNNIINHSSLASHSSVDVSAEVVSQQNGDTSGKSFNRGRRSDVSTSSSTNAVESNWKNKARNRHVRFFGIDTEKSSNTELEEEKKAGRNSGTWPWQPSLDVIKENHD